MQGKVLDGQYLNEPFMTGMNNSLLNQLYDGSVCKDAFWWPTQWDPAHWLDKVFGKFKEKPFVDQLLKRTALYHQLFRFGKMHSVAAATSKDLKLPFCVTNLCICSSAVYEFQLSFLEEPRRKLGGVHQDIQRSQQLSSPGV